VDGNGPDKKKPHLHPKKSGKAWNPTVQEKEKAKEGEAVLLRGRTFEKGGERKTGRQIKYTSTLAVFTSVASEEKPLTG